MGCRIRIQPSRGRGLVITRFPLTDAVTGCAAMAAVVTVALCKLLSFDGAAIFVGALAGVASGVIMGEVRAR